MPGGTFTYKLGSAIGFSATPSSRSVSVTETAQEVHVVFDTLYPVTFEESGLPTGLAWTVTLGVVSKNLISNGGADSLVFMEASGSHSYALTNISGGLQASVPYTGTRAETCSDFVVKNGPQANPSHLKVVIWAATVPN